MTIADLTAAQALALVFGLYAAGFVCGLTVKWIKRIRDVA